MYHARRPACVASALTVDGMILRGTFLFRVGATVLRTAASYVGGVARTHGDGDKKGTGRDVTSIIMRHASRRISWWFGTFVCLSVHYGK